jgi:hypothetical protein
MIALKDYQHRVLDSLREFFRLCSKTGNPAYAFSDVCKQNGSGGGLYLPIHAAGLARDMPYVCLRVPTGGGKTLLACHTAGLAMSELLHAVNFKDIAYEPSWLYEGSFIFRKHYFGPKPGELKETTSDGELKEEFKCAQFLDSTLPGVRFWVRNLSKRSTSFRLQTSTDWFYPDFVCQLEDGRILVIEYKGGHLLDATDAKEKRDIGNLWAARSNGRCLFAMPSNNRFDEILHQINSYQDSYKDRHCTERCYAKH